MSNEPDLASRLGKAVAAARLRCGLSQEALAERLNVSKNFVGLIERGQSLPSVPRLAELAQALGLSLDETLLGSDRGKTHPSTKAAALIDLIDPEYQDLAEGYLRSLALLRPTAGRRPKATKKRRS